MTTNYNNQAKEWAGDAPKHLSDWVARPVVLEQVKKIGKNKTILDIGYGTGYFSRKVAPYVKKVIAFEKSREMLKEAIKAEEQNPLGIDYKRGDMTDMSFIESKSIDICVLNFVLPYIHPNKYPKVFSGIGRVLNKNGVFLIIQGHPLIPYLAPNHKKGTWKNFNYKKSRGEYNEFQLPKVGGGEVTVGQYNFTFEDLFNGCRENNLAYQVIKELKVPEDIPKELNATANEVPYIYLEGIKTVGCAS